MTGQVSTEFMIFVSILVVIMTIFLWSNTSMNYQAIGIKANAEAKKLCDRIAFEINSAVRIGNGYKRIFFVDENLYGISNFNISVSEYSVFIDWDEKSVSSSIIVKNITGKITTGQNLIENKEGIINVTNIS